MPISPLSRRTTSTRQSDGQSAECMTTPDHPGNARQRRTCWYWKLEGAGAQAKNAKTHWTQAGFPFPVQRNAWNPIFWAWLLCTGWTTRYILTHAGSLLLPPWIFSLRRNKRNEFLHSIARKLQLWCFIVRITNFIFRRNVFTAIYHFDGKCRATPENSVPYCWGLTQSQLSTLHAMCETFPNTWTQNNTFASKRQYCGCHCWHHAKSKALVNLNARQRQCNDASYTTVK